MCKNNVDLLTVSPPYRLPILPRLPLIQAGPAIPAEVAAVQKKKIDFIQRQAKDAQSSLLSEVDTLKAENRDLKFRLVMRDSVPTASSSRCTLAIP